MPRRIILLSGHVAAGKSTLATVLAERYPIVRFKTQDFIRTLKGAALDRTSLQDAGEALDRETGGAWVRDSLIRELDKYPQDVWVLIDSVRIPEQCDGLRQAFGPLVVHLHLTASTETLSRRYAKRSDRIKELPSYEDVLANETERAVERLATIADIVLNTERSTEEDVAIRAASLLGLYGRGISPLVDVLVGGQWGSEGKGNVAAYLSPDYDVLVRVGGPNAGHQVYEEPQPAKFFHLPSGTTRAPNSTIVLAAGCTIWVPKLQEEISRCEVGPDRLRIDPQAMIIEELDREQEGGLKASIGSTAQGVGQATARKILRTAATPSVRLAKDIPELRPYIQETLEILDDAFFKGNKILLEGTQGTGLSLHHGDYPYVTSRETTVSGCLADAGIAPSRVRRIVMVCRTYPIRVANPPKGTSGPMGNEISWEIVAERSGLDAAELREAELTTTTRRQRRVAEFNWRLLRRAATLNGPTDIALSFSDYLNKNNAHARRFEQLSEDTIQFVEEIERVASAPVSLIVTRFAFRNVIDRRRW